MIGSSQILVSSCKSYVVSLSSVLNINNSLEITSNNHLPLFLIELDNQRREMELDQHKKMTTLRNDLEKELRKHAKRQAAVSENLQKKPCNFRRSQRLKSTFFWKVFLNGAVPKGPTG